MPWKSASGAGSGKTGTMRSKSIRGQISAPIPVPDPLEQDVGDNLPGVPSNQLHSVSGQSDSSPPRSRPNTTLRQSAGRSTNPSSMASSVGPGGSRLSKSQPSGQPERKKSTLRKVFGKLFGKREKTPSRTSKSSYGDAPLHPQHRSDPTGDAKPMADKVDARANSVPVTEYDRALRSHSIGPEDVMAIQSARNSMAAECSLARKRTGTSSPHALGARYIGGGKLAGLSPRPASVNDRYDESAYGVDDPNEIGRAITSDSRGLKRRSRSLSAIPNFEVARPRRHRSDDLRFWRDSHDIDFLSPLSSNFPDEDGATSQPDALGILPTADAGPITPAQHFDFGTMEVTRDADEASVEEEAPMATPIETDSRLYEFQDTMARLDGSADMYSTPAAEWHSPDETEMMGLGLAMEPSVTHSSTTAGNHSRSLDLHASSRPSSRSSFNDTLASSGHKNLQVVATKSAHRPLSENTVTGNIPAGAERKTASAPFNEEHYATLLGLLETERSARLALEAQVRRLSHQVSILMKHAGPGDDTEHAVAGVASISTTSAFDDDDDDEDQGGAKRFSGNGFGRRMLDDSGFGAEERDDDDESSQSFATPHEDEDRTFGIYAGENDSLDEHAPRAMSLSQMTMGRMQTTVV